MASLTFVTLYVIVVLLPHSVSGVNVRYGGSHDNWLLSIVYVKVPWRLVTLNLIDVESIVVSESAMLTTICCSGQAENIVVPAVVSGGQIFII